MHVNSPAMTTVTFEYDNDESKIIEAPWMSSRVDFEIQRLLNQPGNEFEIGGVSIPKNFSRYNFD